MALSIKGVKPTQLSEEETLTSYGRWQSTMVYCLSKEALWQRFLKPVKPDNQDSSWTKLSADNPSRGLLDDSEASGKKKEDKVIELNAMLDYIAQWAPTLIRHDLINESTDMRTVWQMIRQYYNLEQSETHFIQLTTIKWEGPEKERPERLYRRILAHIKDNLLRADSTLQHNKTIPQKDEDVSPTVERLAVLRWLELIDPRLPMLVARTFATDLQSRTLKDIQPQIANAMSSLLDQLRGEDAQIASLQGLHLDDIQAAQVNTRNRNFTSASRYPRFGQKQNPSGRTASYTKPNLRPQSSNKQRLQCSHCQGWKRPCWGHTMATCKYISDAEKQELVKSSTRNYRVESEAQVDDEDMCDQGYEYEDEE